jgi:hypothetical protein
VASGGPIPGPAIFVDESGDPGLQSKPTLAAKPYFVVGFVYSEDHGRLRKHLRRLLKKVHLRDRYPLRLQELKFFLPHSDLLSLGYTITEINTKYDPQMPLIRTAALRVIDKYAKGTFAAVVDKRKANPGWTSEHLGNFAFAESLFVNVLNVIPLTQCPLVVYDKGRLSPANSSKFKAYLTAKEQYFDSKGYKRYPGTMPTPIEASSQAEPGIWAADLIAGAYYHKYSNHDSTYSNVLSVSRVGTGERLYWP